MTFFAQRNNLCSIDFFLSNTKKSSLCKKIWNHFGKNAKNGRFYDFFCVRDYRISKKICQKCQKWHIFWIFLRSRLQNTQNIDKIDIFQQTCAIFLVQNQNFLIFFCVYHKKVNTTGVVPLFKKCHFLQIAFFCYFSIYLYVYSIYFPLFMFLWMNVL